MKIVQNCFIILSFFCIKRSKLEVRHNVVKVDLFCGGLTFWIQKTPESGSETLVNLAVKKCRRTQGEPIYFWSASAPEYSIHEVEFNSPVGSRSGIEISGLAVSELTGIVIP